MTLDLDPRPPRLGSHDPFGPIRRAMWSFRESGNSLPRTLPVGSRLPCPTCQEQREFRETGNTVGRRMQYWSDCKCIRDRLNRCDEVYTTFRDHGAAALEAARHGEVLDEDKLYSHLTLDTFDRARLQSIAGVHPLDMAVHWWQQAAQALTIQRYEDGPPAALYFYSPGKGRGKTHLAAAIMNRARAAGYRTALVNEEHHLQRIWNLPFGEEQRDAVQIPGLVSRLTVFDDIGRREVSTKSGATVRNAWYDLINLRYESRRRSIVTSNYTPDELLERGTICEASHSRLMQMTRCAVIQFHGDDYRLSALRRAS